MFEQATPATADTTSSRPNTHMAMATAPPQEIVVGVVFPAKKIGHLRNVLQEREGGVRFVLIDLYDAALDSAAALAARVGPVDVLLHKLAHEMVFSRLGDASSARRLQIMRDYVRQHPRVVVLDPIESVQVLTNRRAACEMLQRLCAEARDGGRTQAVPAKVPKFFVVDAQESLTALLRSIDAGEIRLPLICKSVEACATHNSHMMRVVTTRADLTLTDEPMLYQEFINHSGRLFKGYVLGESVTIAERQSLPNMGAGAQCVLFNTQEKYPQHHDFHGSASAETASTAGIVAPAEEVIHAAVKSIATRLRETLQLTLFGFDVIISDATGEYYVIDVNYFPSYKELPDFGASLRDHIKHMHAQQQH